MAVRTAPVVAVAMIALGILSGFLAAPAAWLTRDLLNVLAAKSSSEGTAVTLAVGASLATAATAAFGYLAGIYETELGGRVQFATQARLIKACASYDGTSFIDDPELHEQLNLARRGAHEAPTTLASSMVTVASGVTSVASFSVLLATSWPWMLAALVLTSIPMALLQRRTARRMFLSAQDSAAAYRWSSYLGELFETPAPAREMRLFGTTDTLMALHQTHLRRAVRSEVSERRRSATSQALLSMLSGLVAAAGAGVVAASVITGRTTPGDFVLFTAAVVAVQRTIVSFISVAGGAAVAANVYQRFEDFVDTADQAAATTTQTSLGEAPSLRSAIEFQHVSFSYPGSATPALNDFSSRFEVGRSYTLEGPNGAGKTTIGRLLMRFYEPDSGCILWDGIDLREYTASSLRARMSGVMQDYVRYELSAEQNVLTCPDQPSHHAAVEQALDRAGLLTTIQTLPNGLHTMLSTSRVDTENIKGTYLSGGQWQRVAIARALIKQPVDVLLLDEPDAALDAAGADTLHHLLATSQAKITILISHRHSHSPVDDQIRCVTTRPLLSKPYAGDGMLR